MQHKWLIFIGTSLMIFLANIDTTIVNLALATIAKDLHTNLSQIQWIINSYFLTATIFFIIAGKLSDIFGHKQIFLIGTLLFGTASLAAGLAPNFYALLFARLIQGIGFAFTLSIAFLMISNAFPVQQRGFVIGLAMTITGLGQAVGPTTGGIILEELNWNWIFFINVPLAFISFFLILSFAETKERRKDEKIDYIGTFMFGACLTILLATLSSHDLTREHFTLGIAASLFIFTLFYFKETKTQFPLINFKLFKKRDYTLTILIRFLYMYTYNVFLFLIPLYLQNLREFTPLQSGLMLLVYSSLLAIAAPMAGLWNDHVGYKIPIIFSGCICFLTFLILSFTNAHTNISLVLLAFTLFGLGTGVIIPSTVNSTISSLPQKSAGEGVGMFFTIAFVGASLGVAISGAQLNIISAKNLNYAPVTQGLALPELKTLQHIANGTQSITQINNLSGGDKQALTEVTKESFVKGFSSVMIVNTILCLVLTLLSMTLTKHTIPSKKPDSVPLEF